VAVALSLLAATLFGLGDFCGGLGSRRGDALAVTATSLLTGGVLVLVASFVVEGELTARDLLLGMAGGFLSVAALVCFYRGLAVGPMGVVAALAAVTAVILPAAIGLLSGERPGTAGFVGIGLGVGAIVLVTRDGTGPRTGPSATALALGLAAGAGFGGFFAILDLTGDDAGLWPLVGSRVTAVGVCLVAIALGRFRLDPGPGARALALLAGTLDMTANVCFLLAVREGLLTLVVVVTGLYPATTIVLAHLFLRERLRRVQVGGLLLAAGSITLIAAG
jgi:drug/metabolite transporter (DMT)-like permease